MISNPYLTLGLPQTADDTEIRRAYRKLAKKYHPDLNPGNKTAEERFKAISAAYEQIETPERRAEYDQWRAQRKPAQPAATARRPQTYTKAEIVQTDWTEEIAGFIARFFANYAHLNASWRGGQKSWRIFASGKLPVAGWGLAALLFYCISAATLPTFFETNAATFGIAAANISAAVFITPIICLGAAGALTVLNKDLLFFSVLAAFLASLGYDASFSNFITSLFASAFILCGGLLCDGILRAGGSNFLTSYDWEHEANEPMAIAALVAFIASGGVYFVINAVA